MHVGIIGGGITGLTTAYYLLKQGCKVTVFEAGSMLGGLATSTQMQEVWIDKFYHCILPSDTALVSLIADLGLGQELYWTETEMGFLYRGQVHPLTTPLDLLRFSPLSFTDRVRLGVTALYSRRLTDWRALEQVTAEQWLVRFCGERAFNTMWKPLLTFKFGDNYKQVPASWLWGRVKRQATTRRGQSQKEALGYVRGGFRIIFERLAAEIARLGGVVHTDTKVGSIKIADQQAHGIFVGGDLHHFDKVVSTLPITQFLKLVDLALLTDSFNYTTMSYQGVVCVVLALKERLSPYYWMPVVDPGVSFAGIVETTNLIRREDLGGINLVYLVNYVSREDPLFSAAEEQLIAESIPMLENLFPKFDASQVLQARVHRAAFVEPVWTVNYSSRMPRRALLKNTLFVLTTAQLYPEINSTSNCVKQVQEVFNDLATQPADLPQAQPLQCAAAATI
jgi:protoporphyrinogen oxidase